MLCIGGGPIGLAIAQVALIHGVRQVFISEPSDICRAVASQYEGIQVIDPKEIEVAAFVLDHNGGEKCAAIVDSVGSNETFTLGISLLEESGTYVNVALHETDIQFNAMLLSSERSVSTSSNSTNSDVREAYDLLNTSQINVKPWITHRFGLADYQKAFDLLIAPIKQAFKVVFEPGITD
jgi:L-iditol 2-dehydrogenase